MKIARVVWLDAWYKREVDSDYELEEAIPLVTVGILVKENDKGVWLAHECGLESPGYRSVTFIKASDIVGLEKQDWCLEEAEPNGRVEVSETAELETANSSKKAHRANCCCLRCQYLRSTGYWP